MAHTIFVLNGPNLNLLGSREPEIYGTQTLKDVETLCVERAKSHGMSVDFRQSNSEAELISWIQEAREGAGGIMLNAAALTHTSIGLLDALQAFNGPVVEVHFSNIFRRETFRQHSYVSLGATGMICGLGAHGYALGIDALAHLILNTGS